jgi:hypothetical protein
MTIDRNDADFEPPHASSPTAFICDNAELYGYHAVGEPDPRPLPSDDTVAGSVQTIFDALFSALDDTCLLVDLNDLLWSTVNVFHRAVQRIERRLAAIERTDTVSRHTSVSAPRRPAPARECGDGLSVRQISASSPRDRHLLRCPFVHHVFSLQAVWHATRRSLYGLIWPQDGCASIALPQWRRRDFLPLR